MRILGEICNLEVLNNSYFYFCLLGTHIFCSLSVYACTCTCTYTCTCIAQTLLKLLKAEHIHQEVEQIQQTAFLVLQCAISI